MTRPTIDEHYGSFVTTPRVKLMMQLLGTGFTSQGVTLSVDEFNAIKRLYGYKPEGSNKKPPPPKAPEKPSDPKKHWQYENDFRKYEESLKAHANWTDPQPFMQAGADRNAIRDAECDGLRLLAWIAKFVPVGEDPLKTLIQMAIDAGFDVPPEDIDYAEDE